MKDACHVMREGGSKDSKYMQYEDKKLKSVAPPDVYVLDTEGRIFCMEGFFLFLLTVLLL